MANKKSGMTAKQEENLQELIDQAEIAYQFGQNLPDDLIDEYEALDEAEEAIFGYVNSLLKSKDDEITELRALLAATKQPA